MKPIGCFEQTKGNYWAGRKQEKMGSNGQPKVTAGLVGSRKKIDSNGKQKVNIGLVGSRKQKGNNEQGKSDYWVGRKQETNGQQ